MKKWKAISLFSLLGLIALVVSLYLRFPADLCRDVILSGIKEKYSLHRVSVGSCRPVLPIGIKLSHITFQPDLSTSEWQVEEVVFRPSLSSIWGKLVLGWSASFMDGRMEGLWRGTRNPEGELSFYDLNINRLLKGILGPEARGRLQGKAVWRENGRALITFKVAQGYYKLFLPGLPQMEIHELSGKAQLDKKELFLEQVDLTGPSFKGRIGGKVNFFWPAWENSALDLTWEIDALQTGKIINTLRGTLKYPVLTDQSETKR